MVEYIDKKVIELNQDNIVGTNITYIIQSDNPQKLLNDCINEVDNTNRLVLFKDNIYDVLVNNVEDGLVITFGVTSKNELGVMFFKVKKGLDELLEQLSSY